MDGKVVTVSEHKRISEAHKYLSFGPDCQAMDISSHRNYFRLK